MDRSFENKTKVEGVGDGGTYTHGVVAISVAVHDVGGQVWSPCGGRWIKKVGPGEMEDVREMLFLQWTESMWCG
jgi:hypothetical protein